MVAAVAPYQVSILETDATLRATDLARATGALVVGDAVHQGTRYVGPKSDVVAGHVVAVVHLS
ncbi:hypothetical protein GCM10027068_38750 [Prescottella soli]